MKLLFGTAGVPARTKGQGTDEGVREVARLGLGCMELEFVRGVHMNTALATRVKAIADELGIRLSVHAPYWINLNAKEKPKLARSEAYILDSARVGFAAGARDIVFHPAFYTGDEAALVHERVKESLVRIRETLAHEGIDVILRPETTGKPTQYGSLEELVRLSSELPGVLPCVDFAHLHARSGGAMNTTEEFHAAVDIIEKSLGSSALNNMHIHISGIVYTAKGEREHIPLEESDMNWRGVLSVLRERGVSGTVISESPILEDDALLMKQFYEGLA
ncbi:MAG: TIM barrel protein [candidate division WOR-3 bacterium]